MGLHYGNIHRADLGDGQGLVDELYLARQYYFPVWGTCWESLAGMSVYAICVGKESLTRPFRWIPFPRLEAERDVRKQ